MKKTTKIIISLGVALLIAAVVLVVSLIQSGNGEKETTTKPGYSLQSTTAPSTTAVTESWVDLNQIASELATATDTSNPSETSTDTTTPVVVAPQTTIIYVYTEYVTTPQTTEKVTADLDGEPEMVEYKYSVNKESRTVTINKYLGDDSVVWIPETIAGYTVTAIGDKCFQKQSLKGVCIPETVTSIGNNAFQDCKNLKSVTFMGAPSTVTVGSNAFQNCTSLKTVNLPPAKSLGNFAFDGCTSLETLILEYGSESVGEYCFSNCTSLKSLELPESISYVGQGSFGNHSDELVIRCVEGSVADEARRKYSIQAEYI